jgi:plastocyanin
MTATALAAGALVSGPSASASHAGVTIQEGGHLNVGGTHAESMRFLAPDTVDVHQGDRITFEIHGFHTATMLPAGVGADDWIEDNAEGTAPFSFFASDPDDGAGATKDNFGAIVTPTNPACGGADQDPCSYTGDGVLNSGAPPGPDEPLRFTATVNADPGSVFWVICLVHRNMRVRVRVVGDPAAATSQTAIDQARDRQLQWDTDLARATHAKYSAKRTSHRTASGRRVWDAWAGVDTGHVALLAFYPKKLVIAEGDTVRWHFDHLLFEDHTVSLPIPAVFGMGFPPAVCDPDGDAGPGPDTPAEGGQDAPPSCPEGSQLEFDIEGPFIGGTGNGVWTGMRDVEHSGIRGVTAEDMSPPTAGIDPYDVRFRESTGKNGIDYLCFLHGDVMQAKVLVRR